MATATTDQKMLGFMEFASGPAGKDIIKRSDDVTIPLRNVIKASKVTLFDGSSHVIADLYAPSVILAAGGAAVKGLGYANLGRGSTIRCANGIAFKDGVTGTDNWTAIIAS